MKSIPIRYITTQIALYALLPVYLQAAAQSAPAVPEASLPNESRSQRIADGALRGFTWVAFSSTDLPLTRAMQRAYSGRGYAGDIVAGSVGDGILYRLTFGRFPTRDDAGTFDKPTFFPADSWVLELDSSMRVLPPEETSPPEETLIYIDPQEETLHDYQTALSEQLQASQRLAASGNAPPRTAIEGGSASISNQAAENAPETNVKEDDGPEIQPATDLNAPFFARHFHLELQFSNVYESNVDHDLDPLPSYGMVPALHVRFQNRPEDAALVFDYIVARHDYTNTDRWDRISHFARLAIEPKTGDYLHMTTAAEISLRGSSEDRDISNQLQASQEFEFRITRRHRLQLYGTYRIKRYPDEPDRNVFKPHIGLNFQRTNSSGERFETGARYEINEGLTSRQYYNRWTFSVEYRTPDFGGRSQFEFEIKHRRKFYLDRFVEIEDEDHLRRDNRLSIRAEWAWNIWRNTTLRLNYEYETRGSNDPEKQYEANLFGLQVLYSL